MGGGGGRCVCVCWGEGGDAWARGYGGGGRDRCGSAPIRIRCEAGRKGATSQAPGGVCVREKGAVKRGGNSEGGRKGGRDAAMQGQGAFVHKDIFPCIVTR